MDIHVLNDKFQVIYILDSYESLLWTDRYYKEGEFEIYTPVSQVIVDNFKPGNYVSIKNSEHTMIVEDLEIITNVEDGNKIKITGRSLESILDRRIIWGEQTLTGKLEDIVRSLINTNIVDPAISDRAISNFIFEDSGEASINEINVDEQYEGEDLLSVISGLCEKNEIGFKIILDDEDRFVFSLYKGIDRSYAQNDLPWVVFRPDFENIISSNYLEEHSNSKNVTLVSSSVSSGDYYTISGQTATYYPSGNAAITRIVGSGSGLSRKEIYTQASDVKQDEGMSYDEFLAQLDRKGSDSLKEHSVRIEFDGEFETTRMFVYGRDFFLGDRVQVANEYNLEAPSRITEFIYSHDSSGLKSYPTFEAEDYPEE